MTPRERILKAADRAYCSLPQGKGDFEAGYSAAAVEALRIVRERIVQYVSDRQLSPETHGAGAIAVVRELIADLLVTEEGRNEGIGGCALRPPESDRDADPRGVVSAGFER